MHRPHRGRRVWLLCGWLAGRTTHTAPHVPAAMEAECEFRPEPEDPDSGSGLGSPSTTSRRADVDVTEIGHADRAGGVALCEYALGGIDLPPVSPPELCEPPGVRGGRLRAHAQRAQGDLWARTTAARWSLGPEPRRESRGTFTQRPVRRRGCRRVARPALRADRRHGTRSASSPR